MKYSWTTARGAKIDLDIDVKVITEETLWNDGNEVTVPCHKWQYTINSLIVNGREMKAGTYKQQIGRWPENVHYAFGVYVMVNGKSRRRSLKSRTRSRTRSTERSAATATNKSSGSLLLAKNTKSITTP